MPPQVLFGGAMSIELPAYVTDVSLMRDVPDNQEVFVHTVTDQSIIVEILEYLNENDTDALRSHFEALSLDNDALPNTSDDQINNITQLSQISLTQCSQAYLMSGRQRLGKFNESARNEVTVYMALFRLPQFTTDIVVTLNNPTIIHPDSSSFEATTVTSGDQSWTLEQFKESVASLVLVNPSLFG